MTADSPFLLLPCDRCGHLFSAAGPDVGLCDHCVEIVVAEDLHDTRAEARGVR